MKGYDVLVLGAGDVGLSIAFKAAASGAKVALVDKGNVGGTCVNVGCVPSKMLVFAADRVMEITEARRIGISARIENIDFPFIMERMRNAVKNGREAIEEAIRSERNVGLFRGRARFTGTYSVQVDGEKLEAEKIFIATGARPLVPPVEGLEDAGYLTNETVLGLAELPRSIAIIGGGYIAVEYGHFFSAMGAKVHLIEQQEKLLAQEEPEISVLLERKLSERLEIHTGSLARRAAKKAAGGTEILIEDKNGRESRIEADKIMVATGRKSNADLLDIEKAGIKTGRGNYIEVDDYLRTNMENVWALGDAAGRQMFTHAGDKEAEVAWHNASHPEKMRMDFGAVPNAVFTCPQIASVGLTEGEAREKGHGVLVGKTRYLDIVKGRAMQEEDGFAKAVVDGRTGRILGFHIIGPEAADLIQEVANAFADGATAKSLTEKMHIFPALSGLVVEALTNLR
ncbi:MAG: dihydrolipoyl dehydrogenase [Nitrospiraceae bacterium]|nr:dihydrolipoyl dehydrogenase [Nitrospiraceae bacterium]